jgi:hypothetical protein
MADSAQNQPHSVALHRIMELHPRQQLRLFGTLVSGNDTTWPAWVPKSVAESLVPLDDGNLRRLSFDLYLAATHIGNDLAEWAPKRAVRALAWASLADIGNHQPRAHHPLTRLRGLLRCHPDTWGCLPRDLQRHPFLLIASPDPDDRGTASRPWRKDHPYQRPTRQRPARRPGVHLLG